ncbi:uncharacterized protein P174DRAFT_516426 [Aspergillus novofumigatus IBT 16806]|uniref:Uncharacterized protein n=1 Tax=Aspergillus novofumigatus (strain IBT 16806) TaxID=1392255 RepID=A0A2I1BTW2_ASPN1|nr:uncharacterized protein P174DRAFT_516426 [Aspergillus novofumigatus IBT 16806]PKX88843.1 hypothetical protein P174DRAFT_516426 [Aspergillus novofumigatus IBT 16806]
MPVTRSQQNDLHAINNTTMKINTEDPSAVERPPQSRRLVEWISLKDPPNGVILNNDELFATLQEIHKLKECIVIARGRPRELSEIEWLIIEWRSSKDREEFLTSELFLRLNAALVHRLWSQEVAWPIPGAGKIIRANPLFPPQRLYEVLIIYFPADLDQEAIYSIEMFRGLPRWHINGEDPAKYPSAALKSQIPAWIEGTCEYQRQTARRLAYFIEFADEEGEQIYKEKVRYNPRGRPPWDVMVNFFDKLKDLGMIGYKSLHVEFVEVVHYVPENYVPEPPQPISPEAMKRLDDLPAYDSDVSL